MELRIGIYEFFAYTLSGLSYVLCVLLFVAVKGSGLGAFDLIDRWSFPQVAVVVVIAYFIGLVLDLVARGYMRLVFRRSSREVALNELASKVPQAEEFKRVYWPLLLATLHIERESLAVYADSYKVTSILLRNVSLAFTALATAVIFFVVPQAAGYRPILSAVGFIIFAVLSLVESRKFDRWFHSSVCERLAALRQNNQQEVSNSAQGGPLGGLTQAMERPDTESHGPAAHRRNR